jgi:hypothetical protein
MTNPFTHASQDFLDRNPQLREQAATQLASKYHNARAEARSMSFASGREAGRANELMLLEEQKLIFGLRFQVRFPLAGGVIYVADFVYSEVKDGVLQVVVEDAKGCRTPSYKNKRKQFKEKYGMEITEV